MACAKNSSWTETVWGTREFLEIYEIGVFQEKKWLGKFQYSSFWNHKKFWGLEMALKLRLSSYNWSGKEGKRKGYETAMQLDILCPKNMKQG
jgi:hypothetical protein